MTLLNKSILVRVTESERAAVQAEARSRGMSVNDYMRTVALRLPREEQSELMARVTAVEERLDALEGHQPAQAR